MSTTTDLRRQLVLPVRAVRAGLGAAADEDPAVVARKTAEVVPALSKAAARVAEIERKLERAAEKFERQAESGKYGPATVRAGREATAATLGQVSAVRAELDDAVRLLDR